MSGELARYRQATHEAEERRLAWLLAAERRSTAAAELVRAVGGLGRAAALAGLSKARMQQLVKQARQ